MNRLLMTCTALVIVGSANAESPPVVLALKGLDPVELSKGTEVAGKEDLTTTRGRYKYQFATAESKAAFDKTPTAYALQWDGACGRMGPLSGNGSPDRWFVHNKKTFIFASEACRNSFKADPDKFIEAFDALHEGSDDERKRGAELIQLAVKGMGGAKALDDLKTLQLTTSLTYPQKGKADFVMWRELSCVFPDRFREEDSYDGWNGINVSSPIGGYSTSKDIAWSLENDVHDLFRRGLYRYPLLILKARDAKQFVAFASGKDKVGETAVELLTVSIHGATTTLAIDTKSGYILQARYRGRGNGMGDVVKTYSDFKMADGPTLPFVTKTTFDGKEQTVPGVFLGKVVVNPKLDGKLFEKPK